MQTLETVTIKTDNGPVRINKSDYNPETHELHDDAMPAASTPGTAGDGKVAATLPGTVATKKEGKRIFVVNDKGEKIEGVEGIDANGYDDDKAAWDAIIAVKNAKA